MIDDLRQREICRKGGKRRIIVVVRLRFVLGLPFLLPRPRLIRRRRRSTPSSTTTTSFLVPLVILNSGGGGGRRVFSGGGGGVGSGFAASAVTPLATPFAGAAAGAQPTVRRLAFFLFLLAASGGLDLFRPV